MLTEPPREQVSAEYLQNTYEFFHQRHVDNLRSMLNQHQQTRGEAAKPKKESEEMDTEERPTSSREDIDRLSEDIERLSRNIDSCRIGEKVKPIITFTHVHGPESKPSAKEEKVSSPLLEVPSLFLDLSAEMLRPPLGNM